jgi:hypothetical protein
MWHLIERSGVYRSSLGTAPEQTAFNEGMRNAGLMLLAELEQYAPDQFDLMMKERRSTNATEEDQDDD